MATGSSFTVWTARDRRIAAALMRSPLTAAQLLAYSQTFDKPFTNDRVLRRRLQRLRDGGWVRCWQYTSTSPGAVNYYKLTTAGYRMLNGARGTLPGRGFFRPVATALHLHTQHLADFIVATTVAASRRGVEMTEFYAENTLRLSLGDEQAKPDCAFWLITPGGHQFNYVVELDNGTEPVYSTKQRDSLARKVRFYDHYQDQATHRFRVLFLFAEPSSRLLHFLQMARRLVRNKQRRLFYAAPLPAYLASADAIHAPLFLDHSLQSHALISAAGSPSSTHTIPKYLDQTPVTW